MGGMISAKEAAGKWKLTSTRVAQMCRNGEIPGAQKGKKEWLIPSDSVKPVDKRRKKQPESDIHFAKAGKICELVYGNRNSRGYLYE